MVVSIACTDRPGDRSSLGDLLPRRGRRKGRRSVVSRRRRPIGRASPSRLLLRNIYLLRCCLHVKKTAAEHWRFVYAFYYYRVCLFLENWKYEIRNKTKRNKNIEYLQFQQILIHPTYSVRSLLYACFCKAVSRSILRDLYSNNCFLKIDTWNQSMFIPVGNMYDFRFEIT